LAKRIAYLKGASHIFADNTRVNIGGLELEVHKGQKIAILGPNGSGKTTLILLLTGLLKSSGGHVELFGLDPRKNFDEVKKRIGIVFQNIEAQLIAPTVKEDVSFAPRNYRLSEEEVLQRFEKIMVLIGIENLADKIIHYLSGGEKKKVALAGAMVMEPPLLILDEPFEGLDPKARQELASLLELFNDLYDTTVILSTHDVETAGRFADQMYIMAEGNIIMKGKPKELFNKIDELKKANLHAPGILELTYELRKRGVNITPTLDVEKALGFLINQT